MKIVLITLFLLSVFSNIAAIGKERKPLSPETAAVNVSIILLLILGVMRFL
jgi:hypothetical protein